MGLEKKESQETRKTCQEELVKFFSLVLSVYNFQVAGDVQLFSEATPLCHIWFKHLKGLSLFIMSNRTTTTNFLELNVKSD